MLKKGHLSFDVKGAIAQLTRLENNMKYSYSRGYRDGKNGNYAPPEPVTMYDDDQNTKEMQDYDDGYSHGCEDLESLGELS